MRLMKLSNTICKNLEGPKREQRRLSEFDIVPSTKKDFANII
jgi:hypothetical protein